MNLKYFFLFLFIVFFSFKSVTLAFFPKSFRVDFREEHKGRFSKKIKKIKGILFYQYPKKMRVEINYPSKTIFVSNKFKSWYFKPPFDPAEPNEVTITKNKDYFLVKLFDLLQKSLSNNKYYLVKKSKNKIRLLLKKKTSDNLKIKEILFFFKKGKNNRKKLDFVNLSEMHLIQFDHIVKKFYFNNLQLKSRFLKSTFNFVIPPNTRMSH